MRWTSTFTVLLTLVIGLTFARLSKAVTDHASSPTTKTRAVADPKQAFLFFESAAGPRTCPTSFVDMACAVQVKGLPDERVFSLLKGSVALNHLLRLSLVAPKYAAIRTNLEQVNEAAIEGDVNQTASLLRTIANQVQGLQNADFFPDVGAAERNQIRITFPALLRRLADLIAPSEI